MRNNSINWIYTTKYLQKIPNFFVRKRKRKRKKTLAYHIIIL
jgi:hypothetical protein